MNQKIPKRISRLDELANNLWWGWHDQARQLFRALAYPLWKQGGHNPVEELRDVSPETLQAAAADPSFLALYDSVVSAFDAEMRSSNTWFVTNYPKLLNGPIAYFSMEYAIHNSLPIYAGGLGILAGDLCKEASDLGLPLVAVGFMYPQGYFHQHLSPDGQQQETYRQLDFEAAPINRVFSPTGGNSIAEVELGDATLAIGVWQVRVGRTNIYLLDTNLDQNPTQYRQLSARLYIADRERRIQQEIVLGIGGVRVLRALGINPALWHANEGHTAFMMLERVREEVAKGTSFAQAASKVQGKTVFTTHTPVTAGVDAFPIELVERYFGKYWASLGIDREAFLRLGQQAGTEPQAFNMATLAMRMANYRNGVSQLHGMVSRRVWHGLWPEVAEEKVPITHITNGIHISSWIAPELYYLFEEYLGEGWIREHDNPKLWERLVDIPDSELWAVHRRLKSKLFDTIRERLGSRWQEDNLSPEQMMVMGTALDPEVLTIAFVRRFTEYKRPALIFQDIQRLKRIVNNKLYPVQIIFAGKSHPADFPSKQVLQRVYNAASDHEFRGRIVFVEDYDMHMARYLVQGVDVWLNTPRRLQEACGTSGMKASLNGVLHLSVRDGWWYEGYNGSNGWVIGESPTTPSREEDADDAKSLYRRLEEEIVPLYYNRDRNGIPNGWMHLVKEAIRSTAPIFSARRMLKEYTERVYRTAAQP